MLPQIGKILVLFGVFIILTGLILLLVDKIPFLGKLPGDISFKSGNVRVYIPIVTSIVLSIVLTLIINLVGRIK